jgi:hypothetical protein
MKISSFALSLALAANVYSGAIAFIVGPDGDNYLTQNALEKALLTEVKPLEDTNTDAFPPLRNKILGTEVPVSLGRQSISDYLRHLSSEMSSAPS